MSSRAPPINDDETCSSPKATDAPECTLPEDLWSDEIPHLEGPRLDVNSPKEPSWEGMNDEGDGLDDRMSLPSPMEAVSNDIGIDDNEPSHEEHSLAQDLLISSETEIEKKPQHSVVSHSSYVGVQSQGVLGNEPRWQSERATVHPVSPAKKASPSGSGSLEWRSNAKKKLMGPRMECGLRMSCGNESDDMECPRPSWSKYDPSTPSIENLEIYGLDSSLSPRRNRYSDSPSLHFGIEDNDPPGHDPIDFLKAFKKPQIPRYGISKMDYLSPPTISKKKSGSVFPSLDCSVHFGHQDSTPSQKGKLEGRFALPTRQKEELPMKQLFYKPLKETYQSVPPSRSHRLATSGNEDGSEATSSKYGPAVNENDPEPAAKLQDLRDLEVSHDEVVPDVVPSEEALFSQDQWFDDGKEVWDLDEDIEDDVASFCSGSSDWSEDIDPLKGINALSSGVLFDGKYTIESGSILGKPALRFGLGIISGEKYVLKFYTSQREYDNCRRLQAFLSGSLCISRPVDMIQAHAGFPNCIVYPRGLQTFEEWIKSPDPRCGTKKKTVQMIGGILGDVHREDIVLGDVRPQSFMFFERDYYWKLLNFDNAVRLGEPSVINSVTRYSAPEVIRAVRAGRTQIMLDTAADVWSYGVMSYEVFTGKKLYGPEPTMETVIDFLTQEKIDDCLNAVEDKRTKRFLKRMLRIDPKQRSSADRATCSSLFDTSKFIICIHPKKGKKDSKKEQSAGNEDNDNEVEAEDE